jgi:tryptophanyl-tRNA synthetase
MSLRDGTKKMSKSDPSDLSRINLTDDADTSPRRSARPRPIPSRCRRDTGGLEGPPEAENLVNIYAALGDPAPARC